MLVQSVLGASLFAGLVAAFLARRLPARGSAALALTLGPPLGLYFLLGSC